MFHRDYQLFEGGEWVCDGYWLDNVDRARYWYTVGQVKVIVRMKHVLHANLTMAPMSNDNKLPRLDRCYRDQILQKSPIKLSAKDYDFMMEEAHRREDYDYEEDIGEDGGDSENEEEECDYGDDWETGSDAESCS